MIAVDTNVLARLLLHDDETQYRKAVRLFGDGREYTATPTVMLELVWVLEANDCAPPDIERGIKLLLGLANFKPANAQELKQALVWYADGLDFADALHLALSQDAKQLVTFNKKFAKMAKKSGASLTVI